MIRKPPSSAVLRLLDANGNRAREGLRVLEDYARFVLDSTPLSESLKSLRHDLAAAIGPVAAQAIVHRDVEHDVGRLLKTPREATRKSVADVVIAAGKRLPEALRALEEYLKTFDSHAATRVEALRYRFYEIEQQVSRTLRPASRFDHVRLYVLITQSACSGDWFAAATQAIAGGADCLQLREKDLCGAELLKRATRLVKLCRQQGVLSIINDRADICLLSGADGVHLGQDDLPAIAARKLLGDEKIIGVSTHHMEQARQAVLDGADYIGAGPVFKSATKPRDISPGIGYLQQVADEISLPGVAIAGITAENVGDVLATGIRRIAVTAAVVGCEDVQGAARRLKKILGRKRPQSHG